MTYRSQQWDDSRRAAWYGDRTAETQGEARRDAYLQLISAGLIGVAGEAARQRDLFVNSLRGDLRLLGKLRYVRRSQRTREVSVR